MLVGDIQKPTIVKFRTIRRTNKNARCEADYMPFQDRSQYLVVYKVQNVNVNLAHMLAIHDSSEWQEVTKATSYRRRYRSIRCDSRYMPTAARTIP